MRSISRSLAIGIGIAIAAALLAQSALAQDAVPAQVTEAVTGSTANVRLATGLVLGVRLVGIDAPTHGECGAESARERLEALTSGRSLLLVRDPLMPAIDEDGRSLYYVGPVSVSGSDPYGLDSDGDGVGCES